MLHWHWQRSLQRPDKFWLERLPSVARWIPVRNRAAVRAMDSNRRGRGHREEGIVALDSTALRSIPGRRRTAEARRREGRRVQTLLLIRLRHQPAAR
jgi:hypothetical protein